MTVPPNPPTTSPSPLGRSISLSLPINRNSNGKPIDG
jgi:hypothetical protein